MNKSSEEVIGRAGRSGMRAEAMARMSRQTFDLAVIGGGITGAGIALDAASRGFSAALIEKRDFASGTSSRSSKLIHGGLRYLEHLEFALVREALHERATLTRLVPHLSEPLPFLVPLYEAGTPSPLGNNRLKLKLGLWLYDLLAGRENVARHRWVTKAEALQMAPRLEPQRLRGGFVYYDCLTNDSRLVIEVIKAAAAHGATVANYASAHGFVKENGRLTGIEVEDKLTGEKLTLMARAVINATGVWSDEISRLDFLSTTRLRPSKGIHVVMPAEKFGNQAAVLIPSLGENRFLFVIPWCGRTVIGTTDSDYTGELDEPLAEDDEVNRVVESTARFFPGSQVTRSDVISSFAGLRPLVSANGQTTAEVSRKEEIFESDSGLISIIGGKLTTYRHMAARAVDIAAKRLEPDRRVRPSVTGEITLAGGSVKHSDSQEAAKRFAHEFGVTTELVEHLMRSYGGNYRAVLAITRESEELKERLVDGLQHVAAEVVYATRHEMAVQAEDFLERRTRIALLNPDGERSCAARVGELMERA